MRLREDNPADLAKTRATIVARRDQHLAGTRAALFAADRLRVRHVTGTITEAFR
jgi:hypothetical protein